MGVCFCSLDKALFAKEEAEMKKYKITLRDRKNKKIDFFTEKLTFQEAVCVAYKERAHSKFEHTIVSVIEV